MAAAEEEDGEPSTLLLAINGHRFAVATPDPAATLLDFLRSSATSVRSPKRSCGEGGCGACAVLCSSFDPISRTFRQSSSINSCIAPLCSLDSCSITTSDALPRRSSAADHSPHHHPIHSRLAAFHASQCGFCTPGISVSLHSAFFSHTPRPPSDAHHAVVGHICRCTGYRPILDACKSLAQDTDVEDLGLFFPSPPPPAVPEFLLQDIERRYSRPLFITHRDGGQQERVWIRVTRLPEALAAIRAHGRRVKVVVANTSSGYYKEEQKSAEVFIDISRVPELLAVQANVAATPSSADSLKVGAAVTIEDLISALEAAAERGAAAAGVVALGISSHLKKVANPLVRHRASVGGNVVMARNRFFDSDLVPLFLAVDATVEIVAGNVQQSNVVVAMEDFLRLQFPEPWLLKSVTLPLLPAAADRQQDVVVFRSYRAAPRELGNALAFINAAFFVILSDFHDEASAAAAGQNESCCRTIADARLAFGAFGGKAHAIRAHALERFLVGRALTDVDSITALQAVEILKQELAEPLRDAKKSAYRSSVAVGFLFDFLSQLTAPEKKKNNACTSEEFRRNGPQLQEGVEFFVIGKQIVPYYEQDRELQAVGQPMQKTEAILQATGEAVYVDDIPSPQHCLFAGFVQSSMALAKLKRIDASLALQSPGVFAFVSADDIPESGRNVGCLPLLPMFLEESLFATDVVEYVGQLLGVVVADSPQHAAAGAAKVNVEYEEIPASPPILCTEDAEKKESYFPLPPFLTKMSIGDSDQGFADADHVISDGEVRTGSQYYFYMETQAALAVPDEDGCMVVYSAAQGPEYVQKTISACLGIPNHNVRVITRRIGGAFGGKAFRNVPVASACALAAHKLRRPVRISLDRKTDISMSGGRNPTRTLYSVAFKSDGKLTGLRAQIFIDSGWSMDFSPVLCWTTADGLKKYDWGALDLDLKVCKTNLCSKSAMRAPGHVQGSFIADTIMENVAAQLGLDVHAVISRNLHTLESVGSFYHQSICRDYTLPSMWETMLKRVESRKAEIASFNGSQKWQKRGLSVIPCVYGVQQTSKPARVSIFKDGSIVVEVGGIEMGQGLWTKVKQATIYGLDPLCSDKSAGSLQIRVVQADTISLPHGGMTADSTGSESSCEAVRQACRVLVERLMPLKQKKEQETPGSCPISWSHLIESASISEIDLSAQVHWFPDKTSGHYLNYGVAASEIELNVLTGAVTILRSDIIYDCGRSLNPAVDIGQIEGAFVQGIGFFLTEEYEVDGAGEVVSDGTWTYKPPTIDNIPRKMTVEIMNGEGHENRILSSKACGEPPLLLAGSVHSAIRHAIEAARHDRSKLWADVHHHHDGVLNHDDQFRVREFLRMDTPATMGKVKALCGLDSVEAFLTHSSP